MNTPPPPPPPPLVTRALQPSGSTRSMREILLEAQLKKTEGPQVRGLGLKVVNVLLVTKLWGCYNWMSELVLITSQEAEQARQAFIQDPSNPRAEECKKAFTEVCVVESYSSGEVECLAYTLHTKYNFTHVVVHAENDLLRAARIRALLNLRTGQSLGNALRDKVQMKQIVSHHFTGMEKSENVVPTFQIVEGASDVLSFVKKHGFPCVVKPKLGYSSVNTTVLRDMNSALTFCKEGLRSSGIDPIYGLEIEKFVPGPMYHIDGFVHNGKVVISWPSQYIGTVVDFKTNPYIAGFSLSPHNPLVPRLNQFIENVIGALDTPPFPNPDSFPFHAEAWHTPSDDIVLCEIASRGGGGNIKKQFTELFRLNLDELWTCTEVEDVLISRLPAQFEQDVERYQTWRDWKPVVDYVVGWSYIYPKCGIIKSFPTQDPITSTGWQFQINCYSEEWSVALPPYCLSLNTWLEVGQEFKEAQDCADTCCATLVRGCDEEEVIRNLHQINIWFWEQVEWKEK